MYFYQKTKLNYVALDFRRLLTRGNRYRGVCIIIEFLRNILLQIQFPHFVLFQAFPYIDLTFFAQNYPRITQKIRIYDIDPFFRKDPRENRRSSATF